MNTTQSTNSVHAAGQKVISVKWDMGQLQRRALYALCYGASIRTAARISGLSLRRVKVIAKQLPTL